VLRRGAVHRQRPYAAGRRGSELGRQGEAVLCDGALGPRALATHKRNSPGWDCDDLDGPAWGKGFPGKGMYRYASTICNRFASSQAIVGYDKAGHQGIAPT
jgi:hypothetical protein